MTYTLDIRFCGLCLFVSKAGRLHVLLPKVVSSSAHTHPQTHYPVLLPRATYHAPPSDPVFLTSKAYTLTSALKTIHVPFGAGLEKLNDYFASPRPIDNSYVTNDASGKIHPWLVARFDADGGTVEALKPMAAFLVSGHPQGPRLSLFSPQVSLRIVMDGNKCDLDALFGNAGTISHPPLGTLIPDAGTVRIDIRNVELPETIPEPPEPYAPEDPITNAHFKEYFRFFGAASGPTLAFKQPIKHDGEPAIRDIGMTPFTCMTGGGE